MRQYLALLKDVLENGLPKEDRTGTGTISVFGRQSRYDLAQGFPLVTTKKMFWKGVVIELLWMLSGNTNIKFLQDNGVHIWDAWADTNGELGPVYGKQWRNWQGIDQLLDIVRRIKSTPYDRRLIISAWNVAELSQMSLPPCHCFFQFYVNNNKLSCQVYQRSCDMFLGVPFDIASYALLTHLMAQTTGYEPGELIHVYGDAHIYNNHISQVRQQLLRSPMQLPKLVLAERVNVFGCMLEDIQLVNYESWPAIKAAISV